MTTLQPPRGPAHPGARGRRRARSGSAPAAYDFRRPIQLSREHTRLLQVSLEGFARQMGTVFTAALRSVCTVELDGVAQQTYAEHVDSLDAMSYAVTVGIDPVPGLALLDVPLPAVMSALDLMLGGPGSETQPERPLSDIEGAVVDKVIGRLLAELGTGLAGIVDITPTHVGTEYHPQLAQAAAPGDVVVVATFDLLIKERSHRITLCLPFTGLHPFLARAAAPAAVSERERALRSRAAELVDRRFQDVPVDAVVRFRPTRLDPGTLTHLAVGDVVRLAHGAGAPLDVVVGDATFAHATAGVHGARLAALVVGSASTSAHTKESS
ncbi:flagellar motor switch protein FliM [Nocardioides KLBMP 9356]|uniref:Flagellar motor switch protein FliM n=1 Tax=Nocardioides potassii TaxID=2911371 RepID=A0ABS9HDM6_9ACTN|nr:flagellar motor switch protein FliM [Nocardioides potassii]MCF6378228.1 flagellar motor switch protein FliM [Nocardioides potassii]